MKQRIFVRGLVFETTTACNLDCQYCYNIHKIPGHNAGPPPSYAQAKRTLARAFELMEVEKITMSGGEPFLSPRFLELCLFCRMREKKVAVITNGNVGEEENYRALLGMGVKLFQIPLHAPLPEPHDEMTGVKGSWQRALCSMKQLQKMGATVVPVIVLTRINVHLLGETLDFVRAMGLKRVMINRFNVGGRGIENAATISLGGQQLRAAFRVANGRAEKYGMKLSSNVCSPVCVLEPKTYPKVSFATCSLDIRQRPLTLDPQGHLRFCNHSPVWMGNLFADDIEQIFAGEYAQSWATAIPKPCVACEHWTRCYGGCRAASEQLGLGLHTVDPLYSERVL